MVFTRAHARIAMLLHGRVAMLGALVACDADDRRRRRRCRAEMSENV